MSSPNKFNRNLIRLYLNVKKIIHHKLIEKGKGLPFSIVSSQDQGFHANDLFQPSLRDFHVIFWFRKGTGHYYIDFKKYEFKPNTIVLVSKDQYHYLEKSEDDWEFISIPFKEEFIYRTDNDLRHLFHFNIGQHFEGQQILHLNTTDSKMLEELVGQMKTVYHSWSGINRSNAFYHLLCFFLICCESIQTPQALFTAKKKREPSNLLLEFNRLIEKHFRQNQKVNFYVDLLHTNFKTLSNLTNQHYKVSPKQVIKERVILEIKRQLKGTQKSSKEIAYELGFDEPTNMIKYFKKNTGITPSEFKANH